MPDNIKIQSFLDAVYSSAEQKSRSMIREIDEAADRAYRAFYEREKKAADVRIAREMSRVNVSTAAETSAAEREIRSSLFRRREEITDEVFSEVKKKLLKYRQTEEYKNRLTRDALRLSELLGNEAAVIYVGEFDKDKIDDIKSTIRDAKVEISGDIKLGGLLGVLEDRIYDCTLDGRLEDARDEFIENSGMKVM